MGGSEFLLVLGFLQGIVVPVVTIVLLVKILGRLDDIARRLDAGGSIAPSVGSSRPDRPLTAIERE